MDDPFKRAWLTFVGFSVGIFLIAQAMTANGTAVRSNPAWHFVSTIYRIFICLWVLLLAVAAIAFLAIVIFAIFEAIHEKERLRVDAERQRITQITNEKIRAKEAQRKEREEKRAKEEALARERDRQTAINQEMERKMKRSTEQAVDEAFNEF